MKYLVKKLLKYFLPPSIHIFNREINTLRTEHDREQRDLLATFKQEEELLWQKLQEILCIQNEQLLREQELKFVDLRNECKVQIDTMQLMMRKIENQIFEQMVKQEQSKNQIISAVWDSRNGALWEEKEELRTYNRQWQQIFWYLLAVRGDVSFLKAKETFFKALPKAEGRLRQLQRMELYLLQQLKRICEKNGLRYWMTDGSLLGTVRHEGFVPWDDDMDVGMPRADFERLREVLRDNEHFQVVDYYCLAEPRWYSKISKFVDLDSGSSVFIDLFPYDYYDVKTRQEALAQYHSRRAELVSELEKLVPSLKHRYRDVRVEDPKDKAALDAVFAEYVEGLPQNGKWFGWSIEIWESEARIGFLKNTILPCVQGTFEGISVSIPADANTWLEQVYGEYMEFPRDVGIQNHMKMFGIDQQEQQIRDFLMQKVAELQESSQNLEMATEDGAERTGQTKME